MKNFKSMNILNPCGKKRRRSIPAMRFLRLCLGSLPKISVFFITAALSILCGCTSVNQVTKAEPARSAGFLPAPELLSEMRERYPFHGAWMNMKVKDYRRYRSLYLAPVDTSLLAKNEWWKKAKENNEDLDQDAEDFAMETESIFRDVFREEMKLSITNEPGADTLVLELSVVELIPSKVWLSAIGLAAFATPLAIGIPAGTVAALGQNGTVAVEGILRDGASGEILLMFADREAAKIRILDLTTLTFYGHAREIMNDWAHQILEILTTPHDHMVPDSDGFVWSPL